MYVVLEFPVTSKLHSADDSDHRSRVRAEELRQSSHTEENKLAWPFEGGTNNGLPFRAQEAEASRRAHDRNLTRDFPPRFHRAQKHVGKQRSCQPLHGLLNNIMFLAAAQDGYNAGAAQGQFFCVTETLLPGAFHAS